MLDNLDNSSEIAIARIRKITGTLSNFTSLMCVPEMSELGCNEEDLILNVLDLLDKVALASFFQNQSRTFSACIHLAGLKAVGESVKLPLHYYHNNVTGTLNLLHFLDKFNCRNFVFSSSACVYGDPDSVPISEDAAIRPENPYGQTKAFIEQIMTDFSKSAPGKWNMISLRYFNPIGAHPSGLIGEDPQGFPNNLVPYVAQVAVGKREKLSVFGNDYPTKDGTGVRDYIHITDLAKGHLAALEKILSEKSEENVSESKVPLEVYNLGTGNGVSVLEVVEAFSKACGHDIPYVFADRRPGDIAACFADPSLAKEKLKWEAKLDINSMCRDAWNWQKNNPNGYRTVSESMKNGSVKRKGLVFKLYE